MIGTHSVDYRCGIAGNAVAAMMRACEAIET